MAENPTPAPKPSPTLDEVAQKLLARGYKAANAYRRPDLAERAVTLLERITDDALRVMLVGEFKHGKSSLLNALLGRPVSPVDADIATSAPIVVRHGSPEHAVALVERDDGEVEVDVALDDLPRWVTEGGNPGNGRRVRRVDVVLDDPVLGAGLAFVDTPGVGGLASVHGTITAGALPMADAVLFVSDAAQELSANEMEFLSTVVRICPTAAYVLTKVDVHHHWRRIAELDEGHLAAAGTPLPMFAVSSTLRGLADEREDDDIAVESGFDPLMRWLARSVIKVGRQRTSTLVGSQVAEMAEQLAEPFRVQRTILAADDPSALTDALAAAKERVDALKATGGKWSSTLGDRFGDLQSDVDHDLRLRMRDLNRKVDEMIDGFDPAEAWAEFEPWLYRETGAAVTENYALLVDRVRELVVEVSEVFGDDASGAEFTARMSVAEDLVGSVGPGAAVAVQKAGFVAESMAVLRGGYSVGMFSTWAGLAGIALTNPVSAALAVVMGRKGLRDERSRQLGQRRAQAKAAARRYVDEVNFCVGKDSRDTMRHLQRDLREHFAARVEEANRTAAATLAAAQAAAKEGVEGRERRLADIDAELERLDALAAMARDLVVAGSPAPAAGAAASAGSMPAGAGS